MARRKWIVCFFTFLIVVSIDTYSVGMGAQGGVNLQFNTTDEFAIDLSGAASLLIWQDWGGHWGFNADFSSSAISVGLSLDWLLTAWRLADFRYSRTTDSRPELANPPYCTLNWGFGPGLFLDCRLLPDSISSIKDYLTVGIRLPIVFFLSVKDDWSGETKSTVFLQVAPGVSTDTASFDKNFGFEDIKLSAACALGVVFWF